MDAFKSASLRDGRIPPVCPFVDRRRFGRPFRTDERSGDQQVVCPPELGDRSADTPLPRSLVIVQHGCNPLKCEVFQHDQMSTSPPEAGMSPVPPCRETSPTRRRSSRPRAGGVLHSPRDLPPRQRTRGGSFFAHPVKATSNATLNPNRLAHRANCRRCHTELSVRGVAGLWIAERLPVFSSPHPALSRRGKGAWRVIFRSILWCDVVMAPHTANGSSRNSAPTAASSARLLQGQTLQYQDTAQRDERQPQPPRWVDLPLGLRRAGHRE